MNAPDLADAGDIGNDTPLVLTPCDASVIDGATRVDADITADEIWSGAVYVVGDVEVTSGATLTIRPGTAIVMADSSDLMIANGELRAVGTAAYPIRFCGEQPTPGFWRRVFVSTSARATSMLSHVEIRHGGVGGAYVLVLFAAITLDHVTAEDNLWPVWIAAQGLNPASTHLTISRTPSLQVVPNALFTIPAGGDLGEGILVEGGEVTASGTIRNLGVPYHVIGDLDVIDGASVTIAPGVHMRFTDARTMSVGSEGDDVEIVAVGTPAAPIVIDAIGGEAGSWYGLVVGPNLTAGSRFENVEIRHGADACLTALAPITITGSRFTDCDGYGILKTTSDTTDYVTGNVFVNVELGSVGTL